jgi:iron-sulfur cluster assembly protein
VGEPVLTLTPEAWWELYRFRAQEGVLGIYLRVFVKGGGCSGFTYDMDLLHGHPSSRDVVWEQADPLPGSSGWPLLIAVDPVSAQYLRGCVIHWSKGKLQSGFRFENPMAKSTCGCGKSFAA